MAASPFRYFRDNIKPLMAVFTALLVFAWAGGGGLTTYFSGGADSAASQRQNAGTVAVSWDGGKLTNRQVQDMVLRRRLLNQFLGQVEAFGRKSAIDAGVDPRELRVPDMRGAETPQQGVEQSVVQTRLFADAAREAGMHVSDQAIVQYLDQLGRGNVSREQMREILAQMNNGRGGVSIDEMMSSLREEMLAHNYITSHQYAFLTVTPEQGWRDWLRVNDRVVLEAAAIPTEKYVVDVKDPTEAELTAFFDKYKERESSPELVGTTELPSATPGFRIPRKIDLSYIEANYDSFLTKAEEKVTDEEVAKFYEEHKDMFVKADTGFLEDNSTKKDDKKADGAESPEAKGAGETKPDAGAEKKSDDAKPEASAEKKADEAKPAEGSEPAKDGKQSSLPHPTSERKFHLVAFQDAAKDDAAGKAAATAESKAAEPADKPAADKPADTTSEAPATPPATEAAPATGAAAAAMPAAPKKPVQYQPLDEVKDIIRRQLASAKVADELSKLSDEIDGSLDADFTKYFAEVLSAKDDKQEAPPVPKSLTDLAPLAEKYGLKSGKTGPITYLQLREMPIGNSGVPDTGRALIPMLFASKELDLYQPVVTKDIDGNYYIVMKTSDDPGHVPTLAEVHDEVVKAWKFQKAAELAEKHAEELAKKAEETKTPLPAFFADDTAIKVVRTDPFSELTGGDVSYAGGQMQQTPFRLSQPDGIVAPGPDFMKKVFSMKDGEVSAVLNHDHTIAYVIRLVEHQPAINELHTAYLGEANTWSGLNNMTRSHMQEVYASLHDNLVLGSKLDWKRTPDKVEQSDSQEGG